MLRTATCRVLCTHTRVRPLYQEQLHYTRIQLRRLNMTSQAPDNATTVTKSVAAAAAANANPGGEPGQFKDEVTGEMVSKRCVNQIYCSSGIIRHTQIPNVLISPYAAS